MGAQESLQPKQVPQFDPDFIRGTIEGLVCYMESVGVKRYEFSVCGWKVVMKEKKK